VLFAVNVPASATPLAFVVTVSAILLFEKVPLAPLAGAVNVTEMPLNGLDEASKIFTERLVAKVVLIAVLWLFPPLTPIEGTPRHWMVTYPPPALVPAVLTWLDPLLMEPPPPPPPLLAAPPPLQTPPPPPPDW